jgi:hypothetical protein
MVSASTMTPPARTGRRLVATRAGAGGEPPWLGWRPGRLGRAAGGRRAGEPPPNCHRSGVGFAPMVPAG